MGVPYMGEGYIKTPNVWKFWGVEKINRPHHEKKQPEMVGFMREKVSFWKSDTNIFWSTPHPVTVTTRMIPIFLGSGIPN